MAVAVAMGADGKRAEELGEWDDASHSRAEHTLNTR